MKKFAYLTGKRTLDFIGALIGLVGLSPILLAVMFLVWKQDKHSPFYVADRIGKNFEEFKMVKLRSMVKDADESGIDSTGANDMRITPIGRFIRKSKLDELMQLWNVLTGKMSLVGPRPNVKREINLYTIEERKLLSVKPGITDFSSVVFSDEGEILADKIDPDLSYNQLIRPGKSRLALFYLEVRCFSVDLRIILITVLSIFSRDLALKLIVKLLENLNASDLLRGLAARRDELVPMPPPGSESIVTSRDL